MTTVACLAYYAEQPAHLEKCVGSLHGLADVLLAWEGRWEKFPAVPGNDPGAQVAAVELAAAGAMLVCHAQGTWPSQVAKRAQLMEEAACMGDWLFVIDADEWVMAEHTDLGQLHLALGAAEADVAEVMIHRHPLDASTRPRPVRRLYRASTRPTVRTAHNGYVTADDRFLHGDPGWVQLEPALDLSGLLAIGHDVLCRSAARRTARHDYLYTRRRERFESWVAEKGHKEAARA